MKNFKFTPPMAVGVLVVALAILAFALFKTFNHPSGDSGDTVAITTQLKAQSPANAPQLPSGVDPTAGARGMGGGTKSVRSGPPMPGGRALAGPRTP